MLILVLELNFRLTSMQILRGDDLHLGRQGWYLKDLSCVAFLFNEIYDTNSTKLCDMFRPI